MPTRRAPMRIDDAGRSDHPLSAVVEAAFALDERLDADVERPHARAAAILARCGLARSRHAEPRHRCEHSRRARLDGRRHLADHRFGLTKNIAGGESAFGELDLAAACFDLHRFARDEIAGENFLG